jgi:hypothetical protein
MHDEPHSWQFAQCQVTPRHFMAAVIRISRWQ